MTEDQFHESVNQYLELVLPNDAYHYHVPNGGKRSPREGAKFKRMGVKKGHPDFNIQYGGKCYHIELKVGKNRLAPAQKDAHEKLIRAGALVATAWTLDEVTHILKTWGLIR